MKLTEWYSGDQKPARVGVYQRNIAEPGRGPVNPRYSLWDGKVWRWSCMNAEAANEQNLSCSGFQRIPWRGVAK